MKKVTAIWCRDCGKVEEVDTWIDTEVCLCLNCLDKRGYGYE